jgi:hypothetical protein
VDEGMTPEQLREETIVIAAILEVDEGRDDHGVETGDRPSLRAYRCLAASRGVSVEAVLRALNHDELQGSRAAPGQPEPGRWTARRLPAYRPLISAGSVNASPCGYVPRLGPKEDEARPLAEDPCAARRPYADAPADHDTAGVVRGAWCQ